MAHSHSSPVGSPVNKHSPQSFATNSQDTFDESFALLTDENQGIVYSRKSFSPTKRSQCQNQICKKRFGKGRTPYVCIRCARFFCKLCTRTYLFLHNSAVVCIDCYNQLPNGIGQTRAWTKHFIDERSSLKNVDKEKSGQKFNLRRECDRLKDGFKQSVGTSTFKNILHELKSWVEEPDWQKSSLYTCPTSVETCMHCRTNFTRLQRRYNCNICGIVACKTCISNDLLLYFPDNSPDGILEPKLCIIKIVGCPGREPQQALYLKVCLSCSQEIQQIQIKDHKLLMEEEKSKDSVALMMNIYKDIKLLQEKIDQQIPQFQKLVTCLQTGHNILGHKNNTTHQVAKTYGDLSDHLSRLLLETIKLRKLRGVSTSQEMLLKSINLCFISYYQDLNYIFHEIWKALKTIISAPVLKQIQETKDEMSINSAFLSIRQLALEALHLCDEYKLSTDIVVSVGDTEKIIQDDLKSILDHSQDVWDDHMLKVNEFLRTQIKNHRFIHLSKQQAKERGAGYIAEVLLRRLTNIVGQISLQLEARCANSRFEASKTALERLLKYLEEEKTIPEGIILMQ